VAKPVAASFSVAIAVSFAGSIAVFFPMSVTIRFWCQCRQQPLKKWLNKNKKKEKGYKWFHITIQLIVKRITIFFNLNFSLVVGKAMTYFSTFHFSFKKMAALFFTA